MLVSGAGDLMLLSANRQRLHVPKLGTSGITLASDPSPPPLRPPEKRGGAQRLGRRRPSQVKRYRNRFPDAAKWGLPRAGTSLERATHRPVELNDALGMPLSSRS